MINKTIPLWKQIQAAKLASPVPRLSPSDEHASVTEHSGCVWEKDPDSGLSGWVEGSRTPLAIMDKA